LKFQHKAAEISGGGRNNVQMARKTAALGAFRRFPQTKDRHYGKYLPPYCRRVGECSQISCAKDLNT